MQGFSGKKQWLFRNTNKNSIDSSWENDKKSGSFIYRDIDGNKIYEVTYDNNVLYGDVKAYKSDNSLSSLYNTQYNGLQSAAHFFNNKKLADFNLISKTYVNNENYELPAVGEYIHVNPKDNIHPAEMFPGTVWELISTDFILTSDKSVHNLAEAPKAILSTENVNTSDINSSPFTLQIQTDKPIETKYTNLYRAVVNGYGLNSKDKIPYKKIVIPLNNDGIATISDSRILFPTLISPDVKYSISCYIITPYNMSDKTEIDVSFSSLLSKVNVNSETYFDKFNWKKVPNPYNEPEKIVNDIAKKTFGNKEQIYLWRREEDHIGIGPYLYKYNFTEYYDDKKAREGSYTVNVNEYGDPYCALDGTDTIYNPDAIYPMIKREFKKGILKNKIDLYNQKGDLYHEIVLDADYRISSGKFSKFVPDDWDKPNDTLIYRQNAQKTSLIPLSPYVDLSDGDFDTIKPNKFDPPKYGSGTLTQVEGVDDMYDNYHRRNIYGIPDKNITIRIHWGHTNTPQARDFYTSTVISNKDPRYFLPYRTFNPYPIVEQVYRNQIHNNKDKIKEFANLNRDLDMTLTLKSLDAAVDKQNGFSAKNLYPGSKWKYGANTPFGNLIEADFIDIYPRFYTDKISSQDLGGSSVDDDIYNQGPHLFTIGVSYNAMNNLSSDVLPKTPHNIALEVRGLPSGYVSDFIDKNLRILRAGAVLEYIHARIPLYYDNVYNNINGISSDLRNKLNHTNNIIRYIPYVYVYISYYINHIRYDMDVRRSIDQPFNIELTEAEYNNLINYNGTIHIIPMWKDTDIDNSQNPYKANDNINIVIDWGYDDSNNRLRTTKNVNIHDLWDVLHNTVDPSMRVPAYSLIGELRLRDFFYKLNTIQPTDPNVLSDQHILDEISANLNNIDKDNYLGPLVSAVYDANKRINGYTGPDRSKFFMRRHYAFISDDNRYLVNYKYNNDIKFNINVDKILERSDKTFTIYAIATKPYIVNFHWTKSVLVDDRWNNTDNISQVKGLQVDERLLNDSIIRTIGVNIAKKLKAESNNDHKYFTSEYIYYKYLGSDIAAAINKTVPKSAINPDTATSADAFIFSDNMENYQVMEANNVYDASSARNTWFNISKYLEVYRTKQLSATSKMIYNPSYQIKNIDPDFFNLEHNVDPLILFEGVNRSFDLYLHIPLPTDTDSINPYKKDDIIYIKSSITDSDNNAIVKINLRERWDKAYKANLIRPKQKLSTAFPEGIDVEFPSLLKNWIMKNTNIIRDVLKKYGDDPNNYLKWLKDKVPNMYLDYFNILDDKGSIFIANHNTIDNSLVGSNIWHTFRFISNKTMKLSANGTKIDISYIRNGSHANYDREYMVFPFRFNPDKYLAEHGKEPMIMNINYVAPVTKTLELDIPNTSWTYTETPPPTGNGRIKMDNFITFQPYKNASDPEYKLIENYNKDHALRHIFDIKYNTFYPDHMSYVWEPSRSLLGALSVYYRNLERDTKDFDIERLKSILKYPNPAIEIRDEDTSVVCNVKYELQSQIHLPDMRPMTYILEPYDYEKLYDMLENKNANDNDLVRFKEPNGTISKFSDVVVALPEAVMYEWYMWTGIITQSSDPLGYYSRNHLDWYNTDRNVYGANLVEFITSKLRDLRSKHGLSTSEKFPKDINEFAKAKFNIYIISDPIKDPPINNTLGDSNIFATKERMFTRYIHIKDKLKYTKEFAVYTAFNVKGAEFLNVNSTLKIPDISMTNHNPSNGRPAQVPMSDLFKDVDGVKRVGTGSNPVMIIELVVE